MDNDRDDRIKKYEYVMEPSEIREFCLAALWEQFKCRKGMWLRLLPLIVIEIFIIPEAAVMIVVIITLVFMISGIYNYTATYKLLAGQPWCVWVEGSKFKAKRAGYSEMPCGSIQFINIKRHLLMLGYMQAVKRPAWFVIPLRVFDNVMEQESFLNQIRNPQTEEKAADTTQQEYMRFSYMIDGEKWVRFQKGAADILNSTSLGKPVRLYGMLIWGCVAAAATILGAYFVAGMLNWILVVFCLSIAIWMILRIYCRSPQEDIRKQLKSPEIAAKICGLWQVSLAKEGITVSMPMEMKSFYSWEALAWFLETEEAFYIFHQDKRHYIMIAKESFVSWEQVDAFHRICVEHGMQKVAPKKAFYVPGWLTWVLFGLIMGMILVVLVIKIFLDTRETAGDVLRGETDGYAETVTPDYPDAVPLDTQVEVLASLGIHVPKQTVSSVRDFMVEYDMYDQVEGNPYTWLLMDVGAPEYDDEWNLTGYCEDVFWFDFEGYDISTDYVNVLNGMLALAQGSPIESVSDIKENMDDVDWEEGRGTITLSLNWQGHVYLYDMEMYYDWIDDSVLGVLNPLLAKEGSQKYFYVTGDNGQGAIVFFCTPEWAAGFMNKTGLVLETSMTKADKIQ